ncbi:MAG: histidine kinase dimerization/phosphoacceptor domain -containing protein [Sphingomicrobium sp.]
MKQFEDRNEAQALALAIVDTLPDPFLVLDAKLQVLAASRCFYEVFEDDPADAHGCSLFTLTGGRWDVLGLRPLLEAVVPFSRAIDNYEFDQKFANLGTRTIQLSARPIHDQHGSSGVVLLAIKDVTARREVERDKERLQARTEALLEQQKTLLREMQHRIANSLQIIASILLLKARSVSSEETKCELRDAHQRVMSVAAVQNHLHEVDGIDQIDVGTYLAKLGRGLATSMIGPNQDIKIIVNADRGTLPSSQVVSLGLIVTELVINSIKYAFPTARVSAQVSITFEMKRFEWKLAVSDNGGGRSIAHEGKAKGGLGTALIAALAKQLEASLSEVSSANGLKVEVMRELDSPALMAA